MFLGSFQSFALLAILVIFYIGDFWLMHNYDPMRAKGSSRSWSYTLLAWVAAAILILQPWLLPWLSLRITARWGLALQIVGLILVAGGLVLHWWARTNLRQFYGEREEVQPGQYLVHSGPYIYIRHPIYTSYFLLSIGLFLVVPSALMLLGVIYSFWDFPHAAAREEKLLVNQLPGYAEYMRTTPAFLPRLRPNREVIKHGS